MTTPNKTPTRVLQPHQERVVEEKADLDDRLLRLSLYLEKDRSFEECTPLELLRLNRQQLIMTKYSEVLGERIAAF